MHKWPNFNYRYCKMLPNLNMRDHLVYYFIKMVEFRANIVVDISCNLTKVTSLLLIMFGDTFDEIWRNLNPDSKMQLKHGNIQIWDFHLFDQQW
jgi:hypothetical protein